MPLLLVVLLAVGPAGDFVALYFQGAEGAADCEVTRASLVRVMPHVSACLPIELARTEWRPYSPTVVP